MLIPTASSTSALVVSGNVTDAQDTPIPNVQVAFLFAGSSTVAASDFTDAAGAYSVSVAAGLYDVRLTPPPNSAFNQQTLPNQSISGDLTLDMVLVPTGQTVDYSGQVVDQNGVGFSSPFGLQVRLCKAPNGSPCYEDQVDGSGFFALSVPPGSYQLQVNYFAFAVPTGSFSFSVSRPLDLPQSVVETLTIQLRTISGTVFDPAAQPVGDSILSASGSTSFGGFSGTFSVTVQATVGGTFQVPVLTSPSVTVTAYSPTGGPFSSVRTTVDASSNTVANFTLAPGVTLDGQLVDRNGVPHPLVQNSTVQLCTSVVGCFTAAPDTQGFFSFTAGTANYTLTIWGQLSVSPSVIYQIQRSLTVTSPENRVIPIPDRVLSGVVRNSVGNPVANQALAVIFFGVGFDGFAGNVSATIQTGPAGEYTVPVLAGAGTLRVVPQGAPGLGQSEVSIDLTNDLVLDVTLPQTFALQVRVQDRDGAPAAGHTLYSCNPGGCSSSALDAQGEVTLTVQAGGQLLNPSGSYPGSVDHPASYNITRNVDVSGPATQVITLPNRVVTGTVVDPDGIPVPGVTLSGSTNGQASPDSWSSGLSAVTDAAGDFSLGALRGSGILQGTPAAATGLAPFSIQPFLVDEDRSVGIFLQFITETVAATVPPGGTLSTDSEGDGATPSDPIETSVTVPNGGSVSISESPVALSPPGRFIFLTQQINITAPPASSAQPLILVFRIDASRIPVGADQNTLQVFRDERIVPNCTGPSGVAFPDPCVSRRELLMDGDVQLTVLTSRASAWNVGIGDQPCTQDADCADTVSCTQDRCVNGFCTLEPDDALCDNGLFCDGNEQCYPDTGCGPGAAVVCADDSDPCTDDLCDEATDQCGRPATCDDGSPCTVDTCDTQFFYGCFNRLTDWAAARCEVTRLVATPICTPLDERLQAKLERKVLSAQRKADRLLGNTDMRKTQRAVGAISRKLGRVLNTAFKFHAKGRISQECLDAMFLHINDTIIRLYTLTYVF